MKKNTIFFIIIIGFLYFFSFGEMINAAQSQLVQQQQPTQQQQQQPNSDNFITIENPLKYKTVPEIITAIANFFYTIAIPITTLMVIIGGMMFATSSGDPHKVSQAKRLLLYSAIGLGIILLSRAIAALIEGVLM
ncbi:MAG TPA: pilin [Candidatus Pacearchaeota archaeon]|nr:pilin [Candidatus Pacearchaeota archaeon]HOK94015.1 pilin [Candidatus Pacearchaeota archaeon]HPO75086.1 pilin [Candidatus Pacearchaeota archaeon]